MMYLIYKEKVHMLKLNVLLMLRQRGLSVYWLSKQLKISYPTADNMVKNKSRSIKLEHIGTLCSLFECKPSELFVEVENER